MKILEPEEALNFIAEHKNNPDFVLLDIRRKGDFVRNKIAEAVNMPYFDEKFDSKLKKMDRYKIYLVYCSSDSASNIAAETMEDLGFKNINKIAGGISRWHKRGLEIISSKR